jgi:reactive intermediate/imine deaminase
MCADSNTVFHDVEETKSYSRKTKMKIGTQLRARPVLFAVVVAFGLGLASLYIAGQEGSDDSGKLAAGGIGPETSAALDNVQKVLKAAGFELKDVVSVTVYLADIHEFPDMNKVYKSVMPDPKPARATVQAAALVNNARIEISAIAVKQK